MIGECVHNLSLRNSLEKVTVGLLCNSFACGKVDKRFTVLELELTVAVTVEQVELMKSEFEENCIPESVSCFI